MPHRKPKQIFLRIYKMAAESESQNLRSGGHLGYIVKNWRELFFSASRIFSAGITLLTYAYSARILGPTEYGTLATFISLTSFLPLILTFGAPQILEREIARFRGGMKIKDHSYLIFMQFAIWLFGGGLTVVLWITDIRLSSSIIFVSIISQASLLLGALLNGHEKTHASAACITVVKPAMVLLALYSLSRFEITAGINIAILANVIGSVIALAALLAMIYYYKIFFPQLNLRTARVNNFDIRPLHSRLLSGGVFAMMQLAINFAPQLDVLLLSSFANKDDVALYHAASRGANISSFFTAGIIAVATPTFYREYARSRTDEFRRMITKLSHRSFLATAILSGLLLCFSRYYLLFFGSTFIVAWPSMLALIGVSLVCSAFGPGQLVLFCAGKEKLVLCITAVSIIINLVVSYSLVARFGYIGSIVGSSSQIFIYTFLQWFACVRQLKIRTDAFFSVSKR